MGLPLRLVALLAVFVLMAVAAPSAHAFIYWVGETNDPGGTGAATDVIARANLDGSGVIDEFIPTGSRGVNGVAVSARHIYWVSEAGIGRANLDGTGPNPRFIAGLGFHGAQSFSSLGASANHLLFRTTDGTSSSMGRVGLDGTGGDPTFIGGTFDPDGRVP